MATLSAGINFGYPGTEFIVESDEHGVAQSCRNVVTGVEYVGGGGSSDFSTAVLTVKSDLIDTQDNPTLFLSYVDSFDEITRGEYPVTTNDIYTIPVILYKGQGYISWANLATPGDYTYEISGDIEDDEGAVFITGNGSLTFKTFE